MLLSMGVTWGLLNSLLGLNISSVHPKVRISRWVHDLERVDAVAFGVTPSAAKEMARTGGVNGGRAVTPVLPSPREAGNAG